MTTPLPWYTVNEIEQVDTPALIFYAGRIVKNIEMVKSMIGDVNRLRPHVKTHKCIEVTHLMLEAGITKFKCATIAEAEMLAMCNAPDVLLAYQPVLSKARRFISLVQHYPGTQFSCLADNARTAEMLSLEALQAGVVLQVFIDINTGMNRTGIPPHDVPALYAACMHLKGIKVSGLHAYDGHIHAEDLQRRTVECLAAFAPVEKIINDIVERGYTRPVVVAGGTPTFPVFAQMKEVECSPGTFIFWDEGYLRLFKDMSFLPAAIVATRVISVPGDDVICVDLGHKSIASESELSKRVVFLNAPDVKFISHSEEHLVLKTAVKHQFRIGDILYGLPIHICPTCALYDSASVVADAHVAGTWKIIARDRTINF